MCYFLNNLRYNKVDNLFFVKKIPFKTYHFFENIAFR